LPSERKSGFHPLLHDSSNLEKYQEIFCGERMEEPDTPYQWKELIFVAILRGIGGRVMSALSFGND